MKLNEKIIREFLVLISGPIFQFIAYFILQIIINDKELIKTYNYGILLFNLLPIYPLDGGKLLNLFLNIFIPYKKSMYIVIYISYSMILVLLLINSIKLNIIIMVLYLLILIVKEHKNIELKYNKFLLERYLYNYKFNKSKIINNDNNFYRDNKHIIKESNNYYLEKELLEKKYKKYKKNVDFPKNAML